MATKAQRAYARAIVEYESEQRWYDEHGGSRFGYHSHYADAVATGWYTVEDVDAIHDADAATLAAKKETLRILRTVQAKRAQRGPHSFIDANGNTVTRKENDNG